MAPSLRVWATSTRPGFGWVPMTTNNRFEHVEMPSHEYRCDLAFRPAPTVKHIAGMGAAGTLFTLMGGPGAHGRAAAFAIAGPSLIDGPARQR